MDAEVLAEVLRYVFLESDKSDNAVIVDWDKAYSGIRNSWIKVAEYVLEHKGEL